MKREINIILNIINKLQSLEDIIRMRNLRRLQGGGESFLDRPPTYYHLLFIIG